MIEGISSRILPAGGVAVSARSGTGKSSWFFGSDYVQAILLADTGSQGHKLYAKGKRNDKGDPVDVVMIDPKANIDPMDAVRAQLIKWTDEGKLWALDSITTLIEHQCVRVKGTRRALSQDDYLGIVGKARDLSLLLAQLPGFTLFNTSPGGKQKLADGTVLDMPQGSIVTLPALSGLKPGTETILARWTSSFVLFPGFAGNKDLPPIPRGFILPNDDFRPEAARFYCPIKDPMAIITESTRPKEAGQEGEEVGMRIDAVGPPAGHPGFERAGVDVLIERIAAKFPERLLKPGEKTEKVKPEGPTNGKELHDFVDGIDSDLARDKKHKRGDLQNHVMSEGARMWGANAAADTWDKPENIAAILAIVKKYNQDKRKK